MVQKIDNRVVNYVFSSKEVTDALVDVLEDRMGVTIPFGAKLALGLSPDSDGLVLTIITNPDGGPPDSDNPEPEKYN